MPSRRSPADKARFFKLVDGEGYDNASACRIIGIDPKTGSAWLSGAKDASGKSLKERKQIQRMSGPRTDDELSKQALKAKEDFGYFRRRYMGRIASPWQEDAAYKFEQYLWTPQKEYVVLNCPPGAGKALALDTPIPTPNGWTTMRALQPGDSVFDENGKPCTVTAKSEVFTDHDCYEVATDDGASVIADAGHLWPTVLDRKYKNRMTHTRFGDLRTEKTKGPKPKPFNVATTEALAKKRTKRPLLPVASALEMDDADLLVDPYVLGVWLGDGDSAGGRITAEPEDAKHIRKEIEDAGYVTTDHRHPYNFGVLGLRAQLQAMAVRGDKHIPAQYLWGSKFQRLSLLQGLIDTDGHVGERGAIEFCSTNHGLALGVYHLAIGLGVKATIKESRAVLYGRDISARWRVCFRMANAARLPRKAIRTCNGVRTPNRYLTVTKVDTVPTQCIQVDSPSHCYLAGEGMLVTHNSTLLHDIEAWLTVKNRAIRGLLGSSTQRMAITYCMRLRRTLERTRPVQGDPMEVAAGRELDAEATLAQDFGRFQPDVSDLWRNEEFVIAQLGDVAIEEKEATWSAFGLDTGYLGTRVNIAIWDDVQTKKQLKTAESIETMRDKWDDESETRIEPDGMLALVGQRLGAEDIYRHCLDKRVPYVDEDDELVEPHLIEPTGPDLPRLYHHLKYPAHDTTKCINVHSRKRAVAWPEGCLLDPIRLPWRELSAKAKDKFEVVYQQEDSDPSHVLVPRSWINGGEWNGEQLPGCYDKDRGRYEVPRALNPEALSIVTVDPSPTEYWSVQWWLYDARSELRFLMDNTRQKMDAADFLDWDYHNGVFTGHLEDLWQISMARGRPFNHLIVERNGAQRFLLKLDYFQRWATLRQVSIHPHDTNINKADQDFGVQTIAPHYRFGRVRLPNKGYDGDMGFVCTRWLVDEVTKWPEGRYDDCVMAQWFLEFWIPRLATPDVSMIRRKTPTWLGIGAA